MDQSELKGLLDELKKRPGETEWLEFKEARQSYDSDDLGKYFSALSNEANLKGQQCGWLIFGVDNAHSTVGTQYRTHREDLDSLKHEIAQHVTCGISFIGIHELVDQQGRVLMFEIPAAPCGIPVAWKGHYYGRTGESLVALGPEKYERIRQELQIVDWSAQIVKGATVADLDKEAIEKARHQYKQKNPISREDVDSRWDDVTFLNKAKITIQGEITNTTIILLGRDESDRFLSPSLAKITWVLRDDKNVDQDYRHFGPPFLINVERLHSMIRNLNYRYLPDGTLFPIEITKYDHWVIREALHNCIAHQDYSLRGRITVVEAPDQLMFSNVGFFIPGSVENVIAQDSPPSIYRNPFLAQAMVNLNMIDTVGGGIKKMYEKQRERFFPMPDYDLGDSQKVVVKIPGRIIDENYSRLLLRRKTDLDLKTVIMLDKVQKKVRLTKGEHEILKKQRLVEGRYPNIYVSASVADVTEKKAQYIKLRGFDKKYYKDLLTQFIGEYGSATRKQIDDLLLGKLPEFYTDRQKKTKIRNLLAEMSRERVIKNLGSRKYPKWVCPKDNES